MYGTLLFAAENRIVCFEKKYIAHLIVVVRDDPSRLSHCIIRALYVDPLYGVQNIYQQAPNVIDP